VAKTLGYMITWTTYGTWLQGDERGYVTKGKIYLPNSGLMRANKQAQLQDIVKLSRTQQRVAQAAIIEEARLHGQRLFAVAVLPTHIHIVGEYIEEPISRVVAYYKKAARIALRAMGRTGKVWTRGYDKRYCFDQKTLQRRIQYVRQQNPQ
jgi:hypothetical protein